LNLKFRAWVSLGSGNVDSKSGVNLAPRLSYYTNRLTSKFVGVQYKITKNLSKNNTS